MENITTKFNGGADDCYVVLDWRPESARNTYEANVKNIAAKPYARFFFDEWKIHKTSLPAFSQLISEADMLPSSDINRLLEPGYLPLETGFRAGYVASLTRFPACTSEMIEWWFWWQSIEKERYTLWFPSAHVEAIVQNREVLYQAGLKHHQRYVGNTHAITEYIGDRQGSIAIEFKAPHELGIDESRLLESGVVASACGHVRMQGSYNKKLCTMIHLWRQTDDGLELRSRYYLHMPKVAEWIPNLSRSPHVQSGKSGKIYSIATSVAYDQMMHD
ncbi:PhlG protein [Penicillium herquei]|nr:PhlG protein [Penicillium herquei]